MYCIRKCTLCTTLESALYELHQKVHIVDQKVHFMYYIRKCTLSNASESALYGLHQEVHFKYCIRKCTLCTASDSALYGRIRKCSFLRTASERRLFYGLHQKVHFLWTASESADHKDKKRMLLKTLMHRNLFLHSWIMSLMNYLQQTRIISLINCL